MRNKQYKKGFTLVELILYIGISATLLLVATLFLSTLLESRVKNQTIAEVDQQGLAVMQSITQSIRNADAINTPTAGTTAGALSLDAVGTLGDPTIFDLSGGAVRITEGAGLPITLTNSQVIVSSLLFENLSLADTPGLIRVTLTLLHVNPEGRQEYNFSRTFHASAALR